MCCTWLIETDQTLQNGQNNVTDCYNVVFGWRWCRIRRLVWVNLYSLSKLLHKCWKKLCIKWGFCCWIEQIKQNFGFQIINHVHLHGLWWFWDEKFVVHEKYAKKYNYLTQNWNFRQIRGHFLTCLFIVLYLANWNRPNFAEWSK